MKRSEINQWIKDAKAFFEKNQWKLPPYAFFTPEKWLEILKSPEQRKKHQEIIDHLLGWDVADFGSGNFYKLGLLLFTVRNGDLNQARDYAEKIMIQREEQITPWHFHWEKAEDIINRNGGNLIIEMYNADKKDDLKPKEEWKQGIFDKKTPVLYFHDGIKEEIPAGSKIVLKPGESVVLLPRVYHKFTAEKGKGWVLIGEVSRVNDDKNDNRFYDKLPRFLPIEDDEKPIHLLCQEYLNVEQLMNKYN